MASRDERVGGAQRLITEVREILGSVERALGRLAAEPGHEANQKAFEVAVERVRWAAGAMATIERLPGLPEIPESKDVETGGHG
jgi:pilus assembly protein TadC